MSKSTTSDALELVGMILLIIFLFCLVVGVIAGIFAAPGYVILLILGVPAGFWKSAAVGLGALILIGAMVGGFKVTFTSQEKLEVKAK